MLLSFPTSLASPHLPKSPIPPSCQVSISHPETAGLCHCPGSDGVGEEARRAEEPDGLEFQGIEGIPSWLLPPPNCDRCSSFLGTHCTGWRASAHPSSLPWRQKAKAAEPGCSWGSLTELSNCRLALGKPYTAWLNRTQKQTQKKKRNKERKKANSEKSDLRKLFIVPNLEGVGIERT